VSAHAAAVAAVADALYARTYGSDGACEDSEMVAECRALTVADAEAALEALAAAGYVVARLVDGE